jgi:large subunit ribosomal protein L15
MKLHEILTSAGAHKRRTRVGRGEGCGLGKTCGRGTKGKGARSGKRRLWGFEGGQNPILARIPKRGFNNYNFTAEYQVVNVGLLGTTFKDGDRVDLASLAAKKLIRPGGEPVKILGGGELTKKLTVVASAFSASAQKKIADAGGTVERA